MRESQSIYPVTLLSMNSRKVQCIIYIAIMLAIMWGLFWTSITFPFIFSYNINAPVPRFISNVVKPVLTNILAGSIALNQVHPVSAAPVGISNSFVVTDAVESKKYEQLLGKYSDPNHPGCKRLITIENNEIVISGSDELDGSNPFRLVAKTLPDGALVIDFSPKGGPKDLRGSILLFA